MQPLEQERRRRAKGEMRRRRKRRRRRTRRRTRTRTTRQRQRLQMPDPARGRAGRGGGLRIEEKRREELEDESESPEFGVGVTVFERLASEQTAAGVGASRGRWGQLQRTRRAKQLSAYCTWRVPCCAELRCALDGRCSYLYFAPGARCACYRRYGAPGSGDLVRLQGQGLPAAQPLLHRRRQTKYRLPRELHAQVRTNAVPVPVSVPVPVPCRSPSVCAPHPPQVFTQPPDGLQASIQQQRKRTGRMKRNLLSISRIHFKCHRRQHDLLRCTAPLLVQPSPSSVFPCRPLGVPGVPVHARNP
ncbi:hypothetical protein CCMA1212_002909 [Trichoderma ghanense]|uniref:Uncharacterized protein n=1 Tax=Trichoderma ghanense TaxID=65468 RepID=A0ABY2H961_9HYPO